MRPSLIRNYLFISIGITLIFILLGVLALNLARHENKHRFPTDLPLFFAKFVDSAQDTQRGQIVRQIRGSNTSFDLWFLNADGSIFDAQPGDQLPLDLSKATLPTQAYEAVEIKPASFFGPPTMVMKLKKPAPQFIVFGPPPPPPNGFHDRFHEGHRLDHAEHPEAVPGGVLPPEFFHDDGHPDGHRGPPPMALGFLEALHPPGPSFLVVPLTIFLLAIILSSLVSVAILFLYLKKVSTLADSVIGNLKAGDLKSRFPIKRMNEVGNLMQRFNLMADEVERLFERLQNKERTRVRLLQDLAHDLRTPLASMYNMLATMAGRLSEIPDASKNEMINLSLREATYLGRLVEDLLLLSQISDPEKDYSKKRPHDVRDLIEAELEKAEGIDEEKTFEVIDESPQDSNSAGEGLHTLVCDGHLLTRLFRNLFDNAFAFAQKRITVRLNHQEGKLSVTVINDGQGFSPEALRDYGERRITRVINSEGEGRISVGLGSVIVKTIAQMHDAEVTPSNVTNSTGEVVGAQVKVVFKACP